MNRFELQASIAERDVMRYTPAGIPIVNGKLLHTSRQMEAGVERLVEFEIAALAAGEISGKFKQAELGETYQFGGFLARKNRNSKSLVFHILDINTDLGAKNGIR
ncbi:primosomal replication protein N [Janthinobacterium sp. 17J80-10]|uniref:primosomal replication protein N n=1 Tax=Janthinobacterium sp. 17J80-10 TaxID=2497863 RepID=UPI0010057F21|nr:primosomal replication protein N [Janthinobacterium sp. 17J80-10]QAU35062.1 primosomal replication protein N [Janthinobacterium sp. 17J80-10]